MGLPTQTDSRPSVSSASTTPISKPPAGTHSSRISIINIKSSNTGAKNGGQPKEPIIQVKVSSPLYNKHRPTSIDDLIGGAGVPAPKPQDQVPVGVTNNINIIINNNRNDAEDKSDVTRIHTRTSVHNPQKPTPPIRRTEGSNNNNSNNNNDSGVNNRRNGVHMSNNNNNNSDSRNGSWNNNKNSNNNRTFNNGVPELHRVGRSHYHHHHHLSPSTTGLRRPTHSGICRRDSHSADRKDLFSPQDSLKTPSILKDILKQQNLNPAVPRLPRTRKRDLYRHPRSKSLCCRIPSQRIPTIPEENDNDLLPITKVVTHMKTIETLPSYPKIEYLDYPFEENEYEVDKGETDLNGRDSCPLYVDDEYKHNIFNARENGMQRHHGGETKKMGHGGVEGEGVTKVNRMLIGLTEDIEDDIKRFIDDDDEFDEDREEELSDLEFRILEKKLKEEEEEEMERHLKEEYQIMQKKMEDAKVTIIGDSAFVGEFDDHNNNINQYSSSLSIASTSSGVSSSSCASSASSSSSSSSSASDKTSKVSCPSSQPRTPVSPKCKKSDSPDSSLLVSSASSSSSPSSSTSSSPVSVRSRSSSAPPPASLQGGSPEVEDTSASPSSPPSSSQKSSSLISPAEASEKASSSTPSTSTSTSLFSPSSTDGNFKRSYTLPSFVRSFTPPAFKSFQTPRLPILSPLGIVTSHRSPLGEWVPSASRATSSSTTTSSSTSSSSGTSQPSTTTRQLHSSGGTLTSSACNPNLASAASPSSTTSSSTFTSSSVPTQAAASTTTTTTSSPSVPTQAAPSTTSTSSTTEPEEPLASCPQPPSSKSMRLKEEGEHLRKKKAWMRELFFKMPYEEYYREAISKHKRSNSCPRLRFREQKKEELERRRENGELEQGEVENRNSGGKGGDPIATTGELVPTEQEPVKASKMAPAAASKEPAVVTVPPTAARAPEKPVAKEQEPAGPSEAKETRKTTKITTTADVSAPVGVAGQKEGDGGPSNATSSSCWRTGGDKEGERGRAGVEEPRTKLRVVHVLEKKRVGEKSREVVRGTEEEVFGRPLRAEEDNVGRPLPAKEEKMGRPLPSEAGKIWTTQSSNPNVVGDITEGKQDFGGGGVGEDSGGGRRTGRGGEAGGDDVGDTSGKSPTAGESRPAPEEPVSDQPQVEAPQPPSRRPPHPRPTPPQPPPSPIASDSVNNAITNIEYAASILHQLPPSPLPRYGPSAASTSSTSTSTSTSTNHRQPPPPPPKRHSVSTVAKPPSGGPISNINPPVPPRRQTLPCNVETTITHASSSSSFSSSSSSSFSSSSSSSSSISSGVGHQMLPQWDPSFVLANIGAVDQGNFNGRKSSMKKKFPVDYDNAHLTNHNAGLVGKAPIRNGVAAPSTKTVRIQAPFPDDDVIHQENLISPQDDNTNKLSVDNRTHHNGNIYGNRTMVGNTNDNAMNENINGNFYTNNFTTNKGTRPKTNSKLIEQHPRKIRQSKKTEENGSSQRTNGGKRVTIVMRNGESHANHDILFQCSNTTGPAVIVSRFPVSASPVPTPSPSPAPSFMSTSSSSSCSSASSRVRSPAIPTAL